MADENAPQSLADAVAAAANGPKSVAVSGMGMSEEFPPSELIQSAKFLPPTAVRKRVGAGIRFVKASAGGAV